MTEVEILKARVAGYQESHAEQSERITELEADNVRLNQLLRETEAALIEEQEVSARRGDALDLLAKAELKDGPCWCDFERDHVEGPSLACRLARVALEVGS